MKMKSPKSSTSSAFLVSAEILLLLVMLLDPRLGGSNTSVLMHLTGCTYDEAFNLLFLEEMDVTEAYANLQAVAAETAHGDLQRLAEEPIARDNEPNGLLVPHVPRPVPGQTLEPVGLAMLPDLVPPRPRFSVRFVYPQGNWNNPLVVVQNPIYDPNHPLILGFPVAGPSEPSWAYWPGEERQQENEFDGNTGTHQQTREWATTLARSVEELANLLNDFH